jgi:hypothetical protein
MLLHGKEDHGKSKADGSHKTTATRPQQEDDSIATKTTPGIVKVTFCSSPPLSQLPIGRHCCPCLGLVYWKILAAAITHPKHTRKHMHMHRGIMLFLYQRFFHLLLLLWYPDCIGIRIPINRDRTKRGGLCNYW